jgi:hypothetical protein
MKIQAGEEVSQIAVEVPETIPGVGKRFGIRFYDSKPVKPWKRLARGRGCRWMSCWKNSVKYRFPRTAGGNVGISRPFPRLVRFILDNHHTWERHRVAEIHKKLEMW